MCVHNKGHPLPTFKRELSDQFSAQTFAGKKLKTQRLSKIMCFG